MTDSCTFELILSAHSLQALGLWSILANHALIQYRTGSMIEFPMQYPIKKSQTNKKLAIFF